MNKTIISLLFVVALIGIAATRVPFYGAGPTLVLHGNCITSSDCTVTQSFSTTFGGAPTVVIAQRGLDTTTTNVLTVTTTNFIYRSGKATETNLWIAIGAP